MGTGCCMTVQHGLFIGAMVQFLTIVCCVALRLGMFIGAIMVIRVMWLGVFIGAMVTGVVWLGVFIGAMVIAVVLLGVFMGIVRLGMFIGMMVTLCMSVFEGMTTMLFLMRSLSVIAMRVGVMTVMPCSFSFLLLRLSLWCKLLHPRRLSSEPFVAFL